MNQNDGLLMIAKLLVEPTEQLARYEFSERALLWPISLQATNNSTMALLRHTTLGRHGLCLRQSCIGLKAPSLEV